MIKSLKIQCLTAGTVFQLIFIGNAFTLIPFSVFMGVCALFGANTIRWNDQPITGLAGFLSSPFIGMFLAIVFTILFGSVCVFGLWIYSKFKSITIAIKILDNDKDSAA